MRRIREYEIQIRDFQEPTIKDELGRKMITTVNGAFIIGSFVDHYFYFNDKDIWRTVVKSINSKVILKYEKPLKYILNFGLMY